MAAVELPIVLLHNDYELIPDHRRPRNYPPEVPQCSGIYGQAVRGPRGVSVLSIALPIERLGEDLRAGLYTLPQALLVASAGLGPTRAFLASTTGRRC